MHSMRMAFTASASIVAQDHPALRRVSEQVLKKDIGSPQIKKLVAHMRRLLAQEKNGVGLAAPQVGVPVALFIVAGRVFESNENNTDDKYDENKQDEKKAAEPHPMDKVFINPEVIRTSRRKKEMSEGCLSVRGTYGTVLRHEKASIKAVDEAGNPITYHGAGLLAHIFQHEMDHLSGVLFIDKVVSLENEKSTRT